MKGDRDANLFSWAEAALSFFFSLGLGPAPLSRTKLCKASNQKGAPNSVAMAVTIHPASRSQGKSFVDGSDDKKKCQPGSLGSFGNIMKWLAAQPTGRSACRTPAISVAAATLSFGVVVRSDGSLRLAAMTGCSQSWVARWIVSTLSKTASTSAVTKDASWVHRLKAPPTRSIALSNQAASSFRMRVMSPRERSTIPSRSCRI
jgi:hypothetical protein